jgi:hypothetical protein
MAPLAVPRSDKWPGDRLNSAPSETEALSVRNKEQRCMDALDEFFCVWCEPEAWCERCGQYPAIHLVVQDNHGAHGSTVAYVRIWDPGAQTHIAVCRKCSTHYINALGTSAPRHAPQQQMSPRAHRHSTWRTLRQYLRRWCRQLCHQIVSSWQQGPQSRRVTGSKNHPHTRL